MKNIIIILTLAFAAIISVAEDLKPAPSKPVPVLRLHPRKLSEVMVSTNIIASEKEVAELYARREHNRRAVLHQKIENAANDQNKLKSIEEALK